MLWFLLVRKIRISAVLVTLVVFTAALCQTEKSVNIITALDGIGSDLNCEESIKFCDIKSHVSINMKLFNKISSKFIENSNHT